MGLASPPVEEEVLRQERRHDHPDAVVHPPLPEELAHSGVDDRVTGPPLRPRRERALRLGPFGPREGVELLAEAPSRHVRERREDRGVELAPGQLLDERLDRPPPVGAGAEPRLPRLGEEAADPHRPEPQVRREARGPGEVGPVAPGGVGGQRALPEGPPERESLGRPAARVLGRPLGPQAAGRVERDRGERRVEDGRRRRDGERVGARRGLVGLEPAARVRRVDRVRLPRRSQERSRRDRVEVVEDVQGRPGAGEGLSRLGVERSGVRLRVGVGEDRARARLAGEGREPLSRRALPHDEARASGAERGRQVAERVGEEPQPRRREVRGQVEVVEDEDRDDGGVGAERGVERDVVVRPQVPAEPDESDVHPPPVTTGGPGRTS